MSITSGDKVFYYMTRDSLCFLTMAEARYPKRLAFLYLDEIGDMLLAELVREFGNNVSTTRTRKKDKTPRHCQGQTTATFRKNNSVRLRLRLTHILPFQNNNQWRTEVDQTARPFRFINYDPIIQKKQKEFQDERHQRSKLNDDLSEIQNIMKKNITDILDRGEKLDNVQNISQDLLKQSSGFKWGARKLTWQARMQQFLPMAVGFIIVAFVIYVKFMW
jgi:vesicle transport protein SEC22